MNPITAAVTFIDSDTGRNYTVRLVKEGATTDDFSKRFVASPIGWRDGRLAFMFSDVEGEPHEEARHVGNLFNLRRESIGDESWIVSDLDWDTDELALEAKRLVDEDRITGVSIQPTDGEGFIVCGSPPDGSTLEDIQRLAAEFDPETCAAEDWIEAWAGLIIGSATLLVNPAFEDARVVTADATVGEVLTDLIKDGHKIGEAFWTGFTSTTDSDGKPWITNNTFTITNGTALAAAADLKRPPADWFTDPHLDQPTPLTITDDGRVFGHLALWDTCHRGFENTCITPPRESTEYAEFHDNARLMTDDGKILGVGCLTFDVSHADTRDPLERAKRHYDHSGTVGAFVRAGQDDIGIFVAGAVKPGLSDDQTEMMRRLSLSGDWRPKGGQYHLIAAQAVPVPGFAIRARVASGVQVSLTTLGPVNSVDPLEEASDLALVASALISLTQTVASMQAQLTAEKQQREYEKAMEILTVTGLDNPNIG